MKRDIFQMRQEVMTRVRFIFHVRELTHSPLTKALAAFVLATVSTRLFSVVDVVTNFQASVSTDLTNLPEFSWSAMANTSLIMQVILLAGILIGAFLLKDFWKILWSPRLQTAGF